MSDVSLVKCENGLGGVYPTRVELPPFTTFGGCHVTGNTDSTGTNRYNSLSTLPYQGTLQNRPDPDENL